MMPSFLTIFKKQELRPPKIRLVLSSGGARGMAHVGVIHGLQEQGFDVAEIAGASMGAVVGGVFAAGKLDAYAEWLLNLDKMDVFKLVDFTFSTQGFVRGERVFNELKKIVGDQNIEDLPIPYTAVATDMNKREEVALREGNLFQAMRASVAIPTVITPLQLGDRMLVDGGVLNPLPIQYVSRKGDDLLVVVNVNADIPYQKPLPTPQMLKEEELYQQKVSSFRKRLIALQARQKETEKVDKKVGYFDLLINSFDLMQDRLADMLIEKHQPDIIVNISRASCGTFEFYKAAQMIEEGKRAFEIAFEKWITNRYKRNSNVQSNVLNE
jgi:NTE family protein